MESQSEESREGRRSTQVRLESNAGKKRTTRQGTGKLSESKRQIQRRNEQNRIRAERKQSSFFFDRVEQFRDDGFLVQTNYQRLDEHFRRNESEVRSEKMFGRVKMNLVSVESTPFEPIESRNGNQFAEDDRQRCSICRSVR